MALYRATVKNTRLVNGVRLEKGMSVEFVSSKSSSPLSAGGQEVVDAFMRFYGVDLRKAAAVSTAYLDIVKIG